MEETIVQYILGKNEHPEVYEATFSEARPLVKQTACEVVIKHAQNQKEDSSLLKYKKAPRALLAGARATSKDRECDQLHETNYVESCLNSFRSQQHLASEDERLSGLWFRERPSPNYDATT